MKQILFIGHDASRSGAPIVLLHLLRWIKQNVPDYQFELLLLTGGELEPEYRKICTVSILTHSVAGSGTKTFAAKTIRHLRKMIGVERRILSRLAAKYTVALGNTAVTLETLGFFKQHGLRTLCWMHEMDHVLDKLFTRQKFRELTNEIDGFIVGSNAVRKMLIDREVNRPINVVYEFLELKTIAVPASIDIREYLGIPANAFVVGACATIEWRKGVDLFVHIARILAKKDPNIYCVWLGGKYPGTQETLDKVLFDIEKLGLGDRVFFVDLRHDLREYYNALDVFFLPSREDPFPLVCIEAALFEKPVICFQDAGGMQEFVEDDSGFAVRYLDIDRAAEKILALAADPLLRKKMGEAAAAKVRSRHDVSKAAPEILRVIEDMQAS